MLDFFQYDFLIRALLAAIAVGVSAPVIGMFLVVRRYSHLADTLAHVALLGIAAASALNISPLITSLATTTLAGFAIEAIRSTRKLFAETVLALFLSGSVAAAAIILNLSGTRVDLHAALFGSIASVSPAELAATLAISGAIILIIALLYRRLFLVALDEELATSSGLKTRRLNLLFIFIASLSISVSMRIIGMLLVGSLLIIPVAAAIQFRQGFWRTMVCAVAISLAAVLIGISISYTANIASGGAIVLTLFGFFLLALLLPWLWRRRNEPLIGRKGNRDDKA